MSTNKKQVVENAASSAAGSSVAGGSRGYKIRNRSNAPFTESAKVVKGAFDTAPSAVYPPRIDKKGRPKHRAGKDEKPLAYKVVEKKSERSLREAIRELIFLNRVKYHEEQAKKGLEEQKLRKVVRYLLEKNEASKAQYKTTGENAGASFIKKISVTFDEYRTLVSSQAQREEFKKIYLTGLKNYLDSLDEQFYILNPEERPSAPAIPAETNAAAAPAKRRDFKLNELNGGNTPLPPGNVAASDIGKNIDTKNMQAQAIQSAIGTISPTNRAGHGTAEGALNRDLPQIDPLYINLDFSPVSVQSDKGAKTTNDRRDFRIMLIGNMESGKNEPGSIANEFTRIDIDSKTNDSPYTSQETPALSTNLGQQAPAAGATAPSNAQAAPTAPSNPAAGVEGEQGLDSELSNEL